MKKLIFFTSFLISFWGFPQIQGYEYWFDRDAGNKVAYTLSSPSDNVIVNQNITANNLVKGLHQFNFRTWDVANKFSVIISEFFYKTGNVISLKNITGYEYWFDRDFAGRISRAISPQSIFALNDAINAGSLTNGLHQFNIRFKEDTGNWSEITTDFFYKFSGNTIVPKNIIAYQYSLDRDFGSAVTENVAPTQILDINKIIDVSTLKDGLHIISFRFKDDTQKYSAITTDFFYKISKNAIVEKKIVEYQFLVDKDFSTLIDENVTPTSILEINKLINLSAIKDGIHVLNFRAKDDNGNWSSIATNFFIKKGTSILPKNIVGYEYWFNEDYANAVKKELEATTSFTLNTLILPENLTKKNSIFNMRFKDDSGEWSSIISEPFEDITLATIETTLKNAVFYPNPFEDVLYINLGKAYHKIDVQVFDLNGRIVKSQNFENKDLLELRLNLSSGVYQLVLKGDDKVVSKKILRR